MGGTQRGRGGGDFGNHAEGRGIKALSRPADFARTAERLAVKLTFTAPFQPSVVQKNKKHTPRLNGGSGVAGLHAAVRGVGFMKESVPSIEQFFRASAFTPDFPFTRRLKLSVRLTARWCRPRILLRRKS